MNSYKWIHVHMNAYNWVQLYAQFVAEGKCAAVLSVASHLAPFLCVQHACWGRLEGMCAATAIFCFGCCSGGGPVEAWPEGLLQLHLLAWPGNSQKLPVEIIHPWALIIIDNFRWSNISAERQSTGTFSLFFFQNKPNAKNSMWHITSKRSQSFK